MFECRSSAVQVLHNPDDGPFGFDKSILRPKVRDSGAGQIMNTPWALEMKAACNEEPGRLAQILTGAILGLGGWAPSRGASDAGVVSILFEFERHACVEIYSVLIAAGVELGPSGHIRLTELCQCPLRHQQDCGTEITSIELEIQTIPAKTVNASQAATPA
jgi:hypothetical protein